MKIRIDGLDFHYPQYPNIFTDLNLEIPLDARVIITGDSGSGKTTLLKLITGLLEPGKGQIRFEIPGSEITDLHFGYLFQNPDNQIVHFNIERELAFNLENRGMSPKVMQQRVAATLTEYHLADRRTDSPNHLSGGEKQRLALAGMMISCPDILVLDEPCSFLDVHAQLQLYRNIDKLRQEHISVIWISQEMHEIQMADYVIELHDGLIEWTGEAGDYVKFHESANDL